MILATVHAARICFALFAPFRGLMGEDRRPALEDCADDECEREEPEGNRTQPCPNAQASLSR